MTPLTKIVRTFLFHTVTRGCCTARWTDLDGVVGEVVVQRHVADVAERFVAVVPVAVEAQHVPVVVEKLLQRVHRVVRTQRLLGLLHLRTVGTPPHGH